MKIIRTLEITQEEFYDYLEEDLCHSIHEATNKMISKKDIQKGLKYHKFEKSIQEKIEITILEYQRGEIYKSKIKTIGDTTTIFYRTRETEKGLEIIFEQNIHSFETAKQNRFMRMFSEGVYLGRMVDTLYDIQKKIINKRNGIIEVKKAEPKPNLLLKALAEKESNSK